MLFKDKIQYLLDRYSINATEFAQRIGVQKATISHYLTGKRSNPRMDVLHKIKQAFTDVNYQWLIEEDQEFTIVTNIANPNKVTNVYSELPNEDREPPACQIDKNTLKEAPSQAYEPTVEADRTPTPDIKEENEAKTKKTLSRVGFFYSDGSFEMFEK